MTCLIPKHLSVEFSLTQRCLTSYPFAFFFFFLSFLISFLPLSPFLPSFFFFFFLVRKNKHNPYYFNHLKVYNSVARNHWPCCEITSSKGNPTPIKQSLLIPSFLSDCCNYQATFCLSWICLFWVFHRNRIIRYVACCCLAFSFSRMLSRSCHVEHGSVFHSKFMAE